MFLLSLPFCPFLSFYCSFGYLPIIYLSISHTLKVNVKVTQWYLTLCNLMDYTAHVILQARILEWVAVPFSSESSQSRD